ncbi:hypothetical protein [Streptococcus acidominimus]|uniref:Uncharacterized protein n=1 Tax=Streptococcus acidominimus TaxID=1326 RepID=A0A4Y9FPZ5_STRAI|nr:hypothetical protein [Streptococcus acidominimus]MBF0819109.1 hypothetical protein [Streptococcus acidominimus]MBF0839741.1 hypothetical protein [Streptococcus acidominimus]MBF0848342.1 hypothetical protein [Streptococcus danieliae]TFU30338.1 hypothetical protein E4U01_06615 [Streptococcus acidominimus]
MVKWINSELHIENDWYEIRCHINRTNHLKVYLYGLKNRKNQFCIDFGKILFYKAIDEGWELNPLEYTDNSVNPPLIHQAVLVELFDSHLRKDIQDAYPYSLHHYQVLGINFGIDIIAQGSPVIMDDSNN